MNYLVGRYESVLGQGFYEMNRFNLQVPTLHSFTTLYSEYMNAYYIVIISQIYHIHQYSQVFTIIRLERS